MCKDASKGSMLLAMAGISGVVSSAVAQEASPGAQPQQRITITGTRIPRILAEEASPVQILTADDLAKSGYTTIWQVLGTITANGQGALSPNFAATAANGAAGVALRGLNVGATLVLIDGHRMAPFPIGDDGQRPFVDVSNLPFDAVERIEILKDGASAIYGSDAIAGVVNIILKRSFVGARLTADLGTSHRNDGSEARVAVLTGFGDLARDGHNFYLSAEARKQNRIRYTDRGGPFEKTDFTATGGFDTTPGVPTALNGNLPSSRTGYVTDADGNIVGFMPGCDATTFAAGKCTYKNTWSQIQPPTESYNLLARFTQQLDAGWQTSLQGSYARQQLQHWRSPGSTFAGGFEGIASGPGVAPTVLPTLPPTSIPSTNPSFPAGTGLTSGLLRYTFLDDVGPLIQDGHTRAARLVADLQGSVAGWGVSAAAGLTRVSFELRLRNVINPANLQAALDSTTAPYLVGGPNSAAVIDFVAPDLSSTSTSRLNFVHVDATRDLANLAGGPLSLAVGAGYFRRTQHEVSPPEAAAGLNAAGNAYAIGTQTVRSVYAELLAPLTRQVTAEAAFRYDRYNLSGGKASPKLGVKVVPIPEVGLRATVGRGFRAPGPAENGNAGTAFSIGATRDPELCPDAANPGAVGNFPSQCAVQAGSLLGSNPALKPETSKSLNLGVVFEPSKNVSLSVDFYSIQIDGQIVIGSDTSTVRGNNFTPIGQVQPDGSIALVAPLVAPIAYYRIGYVNANRTKTSGVDVDLKLRHRFEGFGNLSSDFMVTYMNRYDLTIDGVTYKLAGTHGPILVSGDTGNPKTRIHWANTFARGLWSVTGTINHVGSFDLTDPSLGINDCVAGLSIGSAAAAHANQLGNGIVPEGVSCKVASFTTMDLSAKYDFNKQLSVQLSVLNALNKGAPVDWGTYAGSGKPFNPTLHARGAIGRYFTVKATYNF
jgi:iron complex outermembrane recepter protein